jgi:putative two-component system response regulator
MQTMSKKRFKILIVDDNPATIKILGSIISDDYSKQVATSGESAIEILEASIELPDLILLDLIMPGMDGFETCRIIKQNLRYKDIPIIFLSSRNDTLTKIEALKIGGVDYITKPFNFDEIRSRVDVHLSIYDLEKELAKHNKRLNTLIDEKAKEISEIQLSTIYALVKLTDYRDDVIGGHLQRTQIMCQRIAEKLSSESKYQSIIDDEFISNIYKSSPLHDIGKVGIPDSIYLKPGKLTPDEFEVMKRHTTIGAETLEAVLLRFPNNEFIEMGIDIAKYHHEKWDGKGYPKGLSGEAIPISARIMAVSDVFDALMSKRPYKEAFSFSESYNIILEGKGNHFDPMVVDAFIEIVDEVVFE